MMLLAGPARAEGVTLERWSPTIFARAKLQKRFVILDLAAVWCHWCHVMEETTYRDPAVTKLVSERFIAVRVDQDADPELSRRYEDWGWPATIVFAPDGSEIVKRRGYIPPAAMASLLQAIVDDPSPGPSVRAEPKWQRSSRTRLTAAQRRELERSFTAAFDKKFAGWGTMHKFVDAEPLEFALADPRFSTLARRTLDAALQLIDPVWGGMFQYSDAIDWKSPHYEKIMSVQAQSIDMYATAFATFHDARYRDAAERIARYLTTMLASADGAFYVSQDADLDAATLGKRYYALDDAGRRALGMPHIDTNIYARENGWAIGALAHLYGVTHERAWLDAARRAAAFIEAHRQLAGGGFRHGEHDDGGPFLGDTLAMGEAYARLAAVDPEGPWAARAALALDFAAANFRDELGYVTAAPGRDALGVLAHPIHLADENVALARLAVRLARTTGEPRFSAVADHAMHYLTSPTLLETRPFSPGVLLLDRELTTPPRAPQ